MVEETAAAVMVAAAMVVVVMVAVAMAVAVTVVVVTVEAEMAVAVRVAVGAEAVEAAAAVAVALRVEAEVAVRVAAGKVARVAAGSVAAAWVAVAWVAVARAAVACAAVMGEAAGGAKAYKVMGRLGETAVVVTAYRAGETKVAGVMEMARPGAAGTMMGPVEGMRARGSSAQQESRPRAQARAEPRRRMPGRRAASFVPLAPPHRWWSLSQRRARSPAVPQH